VKPPTVIAAAVVSDATSLAVVGLSARQFRAFLVAQSVPHAKVGRRTVARLEDVLAVIDRLSGRAAPASRIPWSEAEVIELAARGGSR
jgi:hypothetical protein